MSCEKNLSCIFDLHSHTEWPNVNYLITCYSAGPCILVFKIRTIIPINESKSEFADSKVYSKDKYIYVWNQS